MANQRGDQENKTGNQFVKHLRIAVRRKYLFLACSVLIMSVFTWGSFLIPDKYEASSTVFIESNVIEDLVKGVAITPSLSDRIRVLKDTIRSRDLVGSVIARLDLPYRSVRDLEEMIITFQEETNIRVKGQDLFIVSFLHKDPFIARDYVNTLVRLYVEENLSAKREEASGASRFLSEQVAVFRSKLDAAEDAIIQFREKNNVYVSVDEAALVSEIKEYNAEIAKIKLKRTEQTALRDSLMRQIQGEEPYTAVVNTQSRDKMIELLEQKVNKLLITYTEEYPEVVKLKAEIETLRNQSGNGVLNTEFSFDKNQDGKMVAEANPVYQVLKQRLHAAESEISALASREGYLSRLVREKESELREIPESKKQLAILEKERDSQKEIYTQLLARLGKSEVSQQMEIGDKTTTFRIVNPAVLSLKPASPDRRKLIIFGMLLGFLGGFGASVLRDNLDNSIRDAETLRSMGLRVLAVIPSVVSEERMREMGKRNRQAYIVAGIFIFLSCVALAHEVLGLNYIESAVAKVRLAELADMVKEIVQSRTGT